jgi:hypothetical protein
LFCFALLPVDLIIGIAMNSFCWKTTKTNQPEFLFHFATDFIFIEIATERAKRDECRLSRDLLYCASSAGIRAPRDSSFFFVPFPP